MSATTPVREHTQTLHETARELSAGGRGILAADESIKTMSQRLEGAGVTASPQARRDYRQLLLTGDRLAEHVSGIILCDETFRQQLADGRPFPQAARELGILPGIKVDTGTAPFEPVPGALLTHGLDGLGERMAEYAAEGAAFAKWRAVFDVATTTEEVAEANADALARYAAHCQEYGVVPIVEPEVLCTGGHGIDESAATTRSALSAVFAHLAAHDVDLAGIVLKPNFVSPGLDAEEVTTHTVAEVTAAVLRECVPAEVPTIAFLSGGNPTERVCAWLRALNQLPDTPWALTFSFGRALVNDALATWAGVPAQAAAGQAALFANCREAAEATR